MNNNGMYIKDLRVSVTDQLWEATLNAGIHTALTGSPLADLSAPWWMPCFLTTCSAVWFVTNVDRCCKFVQIIDCLGQGNYHMLIKYTDKMFLFVEAFGGGWVCVRLKCEIIHYLIN
ncbi:hypothetical protein GOODEAATRI_014100 [Goodea atripinnis]|uniref:Uncharacterized protein n=1 Tax=Goodea atripinnis TaxID=208336 RepID=A0ABV0MRZ7_9TELE